MVMDTLKQLIAVQPTRPTAILLGRDKETTLAAELYASTGAFQESVIVFEGLPVVRGPQGSLGVLWR